MYLLFNFFRNDFKKVFQVTGNNPVPLEFLFVIFLSQFFQMKMAFRQELLPEAVPQGAVVQGLEPQEGLLGVLQQVPR